MAGGRAGAADAGLEAQADLLAACLAHHPDAAAACGAALLRLAGIEPAVAGALDSVLTLEQQCSPLRC
jgi:hypothetical protein